TYTYGAYHHVGSPEALPQRCYPQASDQGPPVQGNNFGYDYQLLQKLVQLRESKLADCSYLTRQRKKPNSNIATGTNRASVSEATPAQRKPAPSIKSASDHVPQHGEVIIQPAYKVAKAPTGPEEGLGYPFQGKKPPQFSNVNSFDSFNSHWSKHIVTDVVGSQFGRKDRFGSSPFPQASPTEYSSTDSATDSESELESFWPDFTWSFPISREERREGVWRSAYSFDRNGRLRGMGNSPVAIILTPPSAPAPKWRTPPNDPASRPRYPTLLHPRWSAKH
ncbi:hypothetical protein FS837_001254, partial [Tulasnella sp. UAMH 9824]